MTPSALISAGPAGVKVLLVLALLSAPATEQLPVNPNEGSRSDISVNVNLVVLQATVRDAAGRYVPGLRREDFTIFEDGVRQTLQFFRDEDVPVTVGLVVDHSGSMRHKLADVVAAARTFAEFSRPEDQMFVVNFNETLTLGLPAGVDFTSQPSELSRAVAHTRAEGKTALYDAVLQAQRRVQRGVPEKRVLVVISDGADNASVHSLADVLHSASVSSAQVFTIGLFDEENHDRNPGVLRKLAQATGGEAFLPREPRDVVGISERIATDIRHQYSLGYVSNNAVDGYHAVRVQVRSDRGRLTVRTRAGYQAVSTPKAAEVHP
ncbi:MAG: VWA domain-containing protein [Acidobacteria bacterium]|nr:VWA domain-containing protein [Acidobacteriota bacterium]